MISTAPLPTRAAPYAEFPLPGVQIRPKVLADETNGQFSMVEAVVEPGIGDPQNVSRNTTKIVYVAAGEFEFLIGTINRRASAGDTVVIPAGAIHSFKNTGTDRGTLFATFSPAGHEGFLREMSGLFQAEDVRPEDMDELCRRYGVEMIG